MNSPLPTLSKTGSLSSVGPRVPFETGSISLDSDNFSGSFTWTIRKYSQIKERKILSDEFEIGTYHWRMLLFPKGNDNRGKLKTDTVAAYICFRHAMFTPEFLNPKVKFDLTVVNQRFPEKSVTLDWGFTQIVPIHELQDPDYGFLVKDTIVFRVNLMVIPRHMPRNNTGFVGLTSRPENDGLNAIVQSLFHLPYFRKAIYNVDSIETLSTGIRMPHSMRRLFYKLQYQNCTASAHELSEMLDHSSSQKIFSNFIEKLMLELMGSNVESVIPNLFEGKSFTCIETSAEGTKTVPQSFKQIDLRIDHCKDLYEALEKRCKVVRVEGIQTEHRYKLFDTLPSILYFQLHSSESPSDEIEQVREGERVFEVGPELNMDYGGKRFFAPQATSSAVKNTYKIHAVFYTRIQASTLVYIKRENTWFKFEDELVQEVEENEAFHTHQRLDALSTIMAALSGGALGDPRCMLSALLYVRTSDRVQIMWETGKDDIDQSIRRHLEIEQIEKERDLSERLTANANIVINVATELDFQKPCDTRKATDLVDLDTVKRFRLPKTSDFEEFRSLVATEYKVPPSSQRYWLWKSDSSDTARLDKLFPALGQSNKKLMTLYTVRDANRSGDKRNNAVMVVNVFLELPSPGTSLLHEIRPNEMLLFFKFYDPLKVDLEYVGSLYAAEKTSFGTIIEQAKELARCHKDLRLTASKLVAVEPNVILCDIFPQSTPYQYNLVSGDVIIIQPSMVPLVDFMKRSTRQSAFEDDSTLGKM